MIEKIVLNKVATFKSPIEMHPFAINYIYGANGSGKTTVSKLLANPMSYPNCSITKQGDSEILVYNEDFVKENFGDSNSIKGIFTLGENSKDAIEFIEKAQEDIKGINDKLKEIDGSIDTIDSSLIALEQETQDICWEIKKKYEENFKSTFTGFLKRELFFKKCLHELDNSSQLLSFDELKEKHANIVDNVIERCDLLISPDFSKLSEKESCLLLSEPITGKEDLPISDLIKKLGNSDWVQTGVSYLKKSEHKCPFCQKILEESLEKEILEFFDETFKSKCNEISNFKRDYIIYVDDIIGKLTKTIETSYPYLKYGELQKIIDHIENRKTENCKIIDTKLSQPSLIVSIVSLSSLFSQAISFIKMSNESIEKNNDIAKDITNQKNMVSSQVWRFICNEIKTSLMSHKKKVAGCNKGIDNLKNQHKFKTSEKQDIQDEIEKREADITNVTHTVNQINNILSKFGFLGFELSHAEQNGMYKLVRADGTDVNNTLSEGEKRFITFLYFFYLTKGSLNETGQTKNRIIVIDDPISSLDSNILFIVSTLVKNIINSCKSKKDGINQVFVLSHNVYFYKEITYLGLRENPSEALEQYWIIKKQDEVSNILQHRSNPIKTTYEMLWRELDDISNVNQATIFNTMRRILEYYFNIIGGMKYDELIDKFEGEDKILCKALISCINDGSHYISDDFAMQFEPDSINKYIRVFELIFKNTDQLAHYNMMRKDKPQLDSDINVIGEQK